MKLHNDPWNGKTNKQLYHNALPNNVDVTIIGGGITGLLCAYVLSHSGHKVALLEAGVIGGGATKLTTAFLTEIIDTQAQDLIRIHGDTKTALIYASHRAAINMIEKIIDEEGVDCEFERVSNNIFAPQADDFKHLEQELAALKHAGVEAALSDKSAPGFLNYGYIELADQAKFNPLRFIEMLAEKTQKIGSTIHEHTKATEVRRNGTYAIDTTAGTVHANHVISATHQPFKEPLGLFFKKGRYRTYVLEGTVPKGVVASGIYEDTLVPYHYFRVDPQEEFDRVIIGGEDHRDDLPVDPDNHFLALETYARNLFRGSPLIITGKWSGPILESSDGLALIGKREKDGILYASGFSGNGMTYAGIAAIIFSDIIEGRPNDWTELYDPDRIPSMESLVIKGRHYAREFVHGALRDNLGPAKK